MNTVVPVEVPAVRPKARHLYEVDVVRILTFVCVIAVHTTSSTIAQDDVILWGFLSVVHFTREVFFALTAFVLMLSFIARPQPMRKFIPRRFLYVGVPYVVWSVLYDTARYIRTPSGSIGDLLLKMGGDILQGTAWFHLYFLLVTMQVYLLLPLIVWLVRATRQHHRWLLGISFLIQLTLTGFYLYWPAGTAAINGFNDQIFISYQFFIIAGAVAADHATDFLAWIRGHRRAIGIIVLAAFVALIGVFILNMAVGKSANAAGTPMQPIEMVWSVAVALGLLAIGTRWADRRNPTGVLAKGLDTGSDVSFGIFLSHPLFIWLLLWAGNGWISTLVPKPWLTAVIYVLVIACSLAFTLVMRRTWVSLALTGRKWTRKTGRQRAMTG